MKWLNPARRSVAAWTLHFPGNVLWQQTTPAGALLVVVAGSMTGEWLSVQHRLSDANSFLWGHQGYEYVDLGRVWQIALFIGLLLWLFLIARSAIPA